MQNIFKPSITDPKAALTANTSDTVGTGEESTDSSTDSEHGTQQ